MSDYIISFMVSYMRELIIQQTPLLHNREGGRLVSDDATGSLDSDAALFKSTRTGVSPRERDHFFLFEELLGRVDASRPWEQHASRADATGHRAFPVSKPVL